MNLFSLIFVSLKTWIIAEAFTPSYRLKENSGGIISSLHALPHRQHRRDLFHHLIGYMPTFILISKGKKSQAYPQEISDKEKILKGFSRLEYLLNNWQELTTVCKASVDNPYLPCTRSPEVVMDYLGYKSMDDPLFRADKTMMRLQSIVPSGEESAYIDAMEKFNEKAEEGNGMAYVSSWGEANPNGGKDRVEYFIERSKGNIIAARDSLAEIIRILGLKVG